MEEYKKYNQKINIRKNTPTYTNNSFEYYKSVEKRTISNVGRVNNTINNSIYKQYTSFTKKENINNQGIKTERGNSFSSKQRSLNNSFSNKQQYSLAGTNHGKNNYTYYVSGIGYVNKNEENKNDKKVTKSKPSIQNPVPKPTSKPNQIKIQQKRVTEVDRKDLLDNYQYHETKNIKKEDKKTLVTHTRLGESFNSSVTNTSYTKKYSSNTEQPKATNKSFQRQEYEIKEQKGPIRQIDTSKYITRKEQISGENKFKYFSNKEGSQSHRNYNQTNGNKRQNSYNKRNENEKISTNYINKRRDVNDKGITTYINRRKDVNIDKERSHINNANQQKKTITNEKHYESRSNRENNQNYNNIYKHEIKVTSRDKNIKNNSIGGVRSTITERKRYFPKVDNNQNNKRNYNIVNRRNINESRTQEINQRIKRTININNLSSTQNTVKVFEHKVNYYPLESVKQTEQSYEINKRENIPQKLDQIAFSFSPKEKVNENIRSNFQIQMRQRIQNVPQKVQEIEVHDEKDIKENIPQFVQQIEVHEGNNELINKENDEKNEEMSQNVEEENIEQNFEQQEEVKQEQEQEISQENHDNIEMENKEIENHEENNNEIEQNHQQDQEKLEQPEQNEILSNNENIPQSGEKEGDLQMEEKIENENQDEGFQIQQMDFDEYIPEQNVRQYITQENNVRNEELYQINQRQNSNNAFNNEQNFINMNSHYCPIHGIFNPIYQNNIFNNMNEYCNKNNNLNKYNFQIGEDGMVENTDNYKFYESKNIKNNGEANSMTLHHLRGDNKYSNKNSESNLYVATKVIPILTDSNFKEYKTEYAIKNNFENSHFNSIHESCPIHGNKNIQNQK